MVDTDDTRRTIHAGRRTTPRVWHKLPTGELKNTLNILIMSDILETESNAVITVLQNSMIFNVLPKMLQAVYQSDLNKL